MAQNQEDWKLELEESAQGTESFSAPGGDIQASRAREADVEWRAGNNGAISLPSRVQKARVRRHLLGEALNEVESAVGAASGASGWLDGVLKSVVELRVALEEHVSVTGGDDGLLAEIGAMAPRLTAEISLIREEHGLLQAAVGRVEGMLGKSVSPLRVRQEVMDLLARLSEHRQRGADLVYEAYNVDIAAGD